MKYDGTYSGNPCSRYHQQLSTANSGNYSEQKTKLATEVPTCGLKEKRKVERSELANEIFYLKLIED